MSQEKTQNHLINLSDVGVHEWFWNYKSICKDVIYNIPTSCVGKKMSLLLESLFTFLERVCKNKTNKQKSKRVHPSLCWFIPQMVTTTKAGPSQSQEFTRCLVLVAGNQMPEPLLAVPQENQQGPGYKVKQLGLEIVVPSWGLTHCATIVTVYLLFYTVAPQ